MIYTDSTGAASNSINGAGQYVIRSKDWTFGYTPGYIVEILTSQGWVQQTNSNITSYSLFEGFSVDIQFDSVNRRFIIASNNNDSYITIKFFDINFRTLNRDTQIQGTWRDGPGIVSLPNKHALITNRTYSIDLIRAVPRNSSIYSGPFTWGLAHVGSNITF